MRAFKFSTFCAIAFLFCSCLSIPPHQGGVGLGSYTYVEDGELLNQKSGGLKKGEACIQGDTIIPGLYYNWRGDASVRAAAQNGNISEIRSVARSYRRPLFGSTMMCTVVYGD